MIFKFFEFSNFTCGVGALQVSESPCAMSNKLPAVWYPWRIAHAGWVTIFGASRVAFFSNSVLIIIITPFYHHHIFLIPLIVVFHGWSMIFVHILGIHMFLLLKVLLLNIGMC
jgi:hypothetical protein